MSRANTGTPPQWSIFHFSQANPDGPEQGDVPALLRRVADSIEKLGSIVVEDITFRSEPTGEGYDVSMTVYYAARGDNVGEDPRNRTTLAPN